MIGLLRKKLLDSFPRFSLCRDKFFLIENVNAINHQRLGIGTLQEQDFVGKITHIFEEMPAPLKRGDKCIFEGIFRF